MLVQSFRRGTGRAVEQTDVAGPLLLFTAPDHCPSGYLGFAVWSDVCAWEACLSVFEDLLSDEAAIRQILRHGTYFFFASSFICDFYFVVTSRLLVRFSSLFDFKWPRSFF